MITRKRDLRTWLLKKTSNDFNLHCKRITKHCEWRKVLSKPIDRLGESCDLKGSKKGDFIAISWWHLWDKAIIPLIHQKLEKICNGMFPYQIMCIDLVSFIFNRSGSWDTLIELNSNFKMFEQRKCFVCLFVWGFTSHSRNFHSYADVIITRDPNQIWPMLCRAVGVLKHAKPTVTRVFLL